MASLTGTPTEHPYAHAGTPRQMHTYVQLHTQTHALATLPHQQQCAHPSSPIHTCITRRCARNATCTHRHTQTSVYLRVKDTLRHAILLSSRNKSPVTLVYDTCTHGAVG